jgi:hypothetical protein
MFRFNPTSAVMVAAADVGAEADIVGWTGGKLEKGVFGTLVSLAL